jgi:hypothetical protein
MQQTTSNFVIEDGTLIKYEGDDAVVYIPESVTRISPYAFYNSKKLKKVETPYDLVRIGKGAFYGCNNLKEVLMPGHLFKRVRGDLIFDNISDINFRFYASREDVSSDDEYDDFGKVESSKNGKKTYKYISRQQEAALDDNAENFPAWSMQKVTKEVVTEQVVPRNREQTAQADTAILQNGNTEVTKQQARVEQVTSASTFYVSVSQVENAEEMPQEEKVEAYPVEEEDDYNPSDEEKMQAIVPDDEKLAEMSAIRRRQLINLTDFLLEDTTLVKYIGTGKEVIVPEFITRIGDGAFANSEIESVYLPKNVVSICGNAFTWCQKLKTINLPEGLQLIDDNAFSNCSSLESVIMPDTVKFIGANAFRACSSLKTLELSNSLTSINHRAFDFCSGLERVVIPQGVTTIGEGAFSHCSSLAEVELPATVITIKSWAFAECSSLKQIALPENLTSIGEVAFMRCSMLESIIVPQSVTNIGRQAFVDCLSLTSAVLNEKLQSQVKHSKVFQGDKNVKVEYKK